MIINSAHINAAAEDMWKWEQSGRTDDALRDAARKNVESYCELHDFPAWACALLLDTIQITVRIANGFPPDYGVVNYDDDAVSS